MSQSQYSLAWDSYKSNICTGLSALQQNGEFVDVTLAADGHFVKVHQVLLALSSTYLKKLISSAPCQHPIIFLNNVSHNVLSYLLEYIYTGEVLVPSECLLSFTEAAKALHIKGLENIDNLESSAQDYTSEENLEITNVMKRKAPIDFDQVNPPHNAKQVLPKQEGGHVSTNESGAACSDEDYDMTVMSEAAAAGPQRSGDDYPTPVDMDRVRADPSSLVYTVSNRGCLQVVLNRYIYNLESRSVRDGVRKWRCVDYRNNKCAALLLTKGNVVLNRANLHSHPFHDKKILTKIEKKSVFAHLDDIEAYKERTKEIDYVAASAGR